MPLPLGFNGCLIRRQHEHLFLVWLEIVLMVAESAELASRMARWPMSEECSLQCPRGDCAPGAMAKHAFHAVPREHKSVAGTQFPRGSFMAFLITSRRTCLWGKHVCVWWVFFLNFFDTLFF